MQEDDRSDRVAIWQTYVQTAENTSNRREAINRYMVPIHLAIWAGHLGLPMTEPFHCLVGLAGVAVSVLWLGLLNAHSKINGIKYGIIRSLESELPFKPFDEEAKFSGIDTGRRSYRPLSQMQFTAAWVVLAIHFLISLVYLVLWVG